ncbi:hypothetical protein [Aestuariibius sp. HNIBRBA575]|uniref:hypothetical protein n=1 Tax=Aestuariibius sp. HNIBRBA575 TaxID=3233343 RepID=UPI0034A28DE0
MAYLKPQTLTCPDCGQTAAIKWIIGVGPGSSGSKPGYISAKVGAEWQIEKRDKGVAILCSNCGAQTAERHP